MFGVLKNLKFYKYQGTGNDFIMLDSYHEEINLSETEIKHLCNRNFGIGADGVIFIKRHPDFDFEMDYYNSDGSSATFCGNGGRCIVAFAKQLHIIDEEADFIAKDGEHHATINDDIVKLEMQNVNNIEQINNDYFLNTGTVHYVIFCENIDEVNVREKGREIRNRPEFQPVGTNINFVEIMNNSLKIRTYEKGVEAETLSCGTGVVASALCYAKKNNITKNSITVSAKGGDLKIFFNKKGHKFIDIWLEGKAEFVFEGET